MQVVVAIVTMLIMTSVAGALGTAVWGILGYFIEKNGYLSLRYFLLLGSFHFWAVPYAYLGLLFYSAKRYGGPFAIFLGKSEVFYWWNCILLFIWVTGSVMVFGRYVVENMRLVWLLKHAGECQKDVYAVFEEACNNKKFLSTERIRLRESYYTNGAKIAGVFHPSVILPVKEFTKEEYRVIFYHELTHVQHKDTLMRNFLMILQSVHFFNPVAWLLSGPFNLYSESSCDEYVCRHEDDIKHYYSVILKIAENHKAKEEQSPLTSQLLEVASDLKRRITKVSRAIKLRKNTKHMPIVVLLLLLMILGSAAANWGVCVLAIVLLGA